MNIEKIVGIAEQMAKTWGKKTLAEFRSESTREFNGTLYESFREENGPRLVLVMGFTGEHEIGRLEKTFNFVDDGDPADSPEILMVDLVKRTLLEGGFYCIVERDTLSRRPVSIVLISAEPRSKTILEFLFDLPA